MLDFGFWMLDRHVSGSFDIIEDAMSYRNLEIWQTSRQLAIDLHTMTLTKLPKFEMHEEGAQIRRSIKTVKSTIVEGNGRRRYKQEFIKFLTYSLSSCDETTDHLETLFETGSLSARDAYDSVHARLQELGKKINNFLQSVERDHMSER